MTFVLKKRKEKPEKPKKKEGKTKLENCLRGKRMTLKRKIKSWREIPTPKKKKKEILQTKMNMKGLL